VGAASWPGGWWLVVVVEAAPAVSLMLSEAPGGEEVGVAEQQRYLLKLRAPTLCFQLQRTPAEPHAQEEVWQPGCVPITPFAPASLN
jgi:hypothetical protein